MNKALLIAALAGSAGLAPAVAQAECFAQPQPWTLRVGAHNIDPTEHSNHTAAGNVEVKSKPTPTFNLGYRVCRDLTIDLLGSLPVTHGIKLDGHRVASTQQLPPTLTLQYHPLSDRRFDPYAGVGINRTLFFRESVAGGGHLQLSNTWGIAGQIGADWHFTPAWFAGVDLRYLRIEPNASVDGTPIGKVRIDPLAYGATLGYRF